MANGDIDLSKHPLSAFAMGGAPAPTSPFVASTPKTAVASPPAAAPAPAPAPAESGPWSDAPTTEGPWADVPKGVIPATPASTVGRGMLQGAVFDPVEGIGQLIEHATNSKIPIPKHVRDWLRDYRDRVQSTTTGKISEVGGAVGSILAPAGAVAGISKLAELANAARAGAATAGGIKASVGIPRLQQALAAAQAAGKTLTPAQQAAAMATATKAPGVLSRILASTPGRVAVGAGVGAAQPVGSEAPDYWTAKAEQAGAGGLGAGVAGAMGGKTLDRLWHMVPHGVRHYGPMYAMFQHPLITGSTLAALTAARQLGRWGVPGAAATGALAGQLGQIPGEPSAE